MIWHDNVSQEFILLFVPIEVQAIDDSDDIAGRRENGQPVVYNCGNVVDGIWQLDSFHLERSSCRRHPQMPQFVGYHSHPQMRTTGAIHSLLRIRTTNSTNVDSRYCHPITRRPAPRGWSGGLRCGPATCWLSPRGPRPPRARWQNPAK
jgi:hypothetical protein